jgi:ribosome recycling factor
MLIIIGGMKMDAKLEQFSSKMEKTIDTLKEEYSTIRAGRANPHLLDKLKVDYYGQPSALQSVANVSVPEARVILIQPWESKLIKEIEKAIINSDLGLNPSNDGKIIRLTFPELTEERRKDLVKDIKKKAEGAKIAIRNIRRDANELFKKQNKASEISEDEFKHLEDTVQKITDHFIAEIERVMEDKSKEILTV